MTTTAICTWGTGCNDSAVAEVFEGASDDLTSGSKWRGMCERHVGFAASCVAVENLHHLPMWTLSIRPLAVGRHRAEVAA